MSKQKRAGDVSDVTPTDSPTASTSNPVRENDYSVPHTPGPWSHAHRENADGGWSTDVFDESGQTIATCAWVPVHYPGVIRTSREANARLIAAAPDLLAACKKVVEHYGDPASGELFGLRAAIRKAEGK